MANRRRPRRGIDRQFKIHALKRTPAGMVWSVVRVVTTAQLDTMLRLGTAQVKDGRYVKAGDGMAAQVGEIGIDSKPSSAAFSAAERDAIVGFFGQSQTEGLTDWGRIQRERDGLDEMDFVEAARVKLAVYEHVH